jgi:transcription antitermination factor NusG
MKQAAVTEGGEACPFSENLDIPWRAVRTRSNFECRVADYLRAKGVEAWVPAYEMRRRWSDRVKTLHVPIFPGYVFCRSKAESLLPIKEAPGVVHIVGFGGQPAEVPEAEVRAVWRLVRSGLPASPCPYLREGMRIRIRSGPLEGLQGMLLQIKNRFHVVVSVHLLMRSVAAEVDAEAVEAIS